MITRRLLMASTGASLFPTVTWASSAPKRVKWRFGHALPFNSAAVENFQATFEEIADRTQGRFKIDMAAMTAQGFNRADSLRLVAHQKVYDLVHHFPSYVVRDEPLFDAAVVPLHGLVDAADNLKVIGVQRDIAREIAAKWRLEFISFEHVSGEQKSVYVLSTKPFQSLDDLKGIKLRHWSRLGVDMFRSVGVPAQVIPASELYLALQNGTVDAAVVPINYAASLEDVTDYAAYVTPFIASTPSGFLARKKTWAALPDEFKEVWQDVTNAQMQKDMASYQEDAIEPQLLEELKTKGITILDPLPEEDRRALQTDALRAWRANAQKIGSKSIGYYDRIVADLGVASAQ